MTVDVDLQVGRRTEEGRLLKVKENGNDAAPQKGNDAKRRMKRIHSCECKTQDSSR